jgi:hypothetical protein
MGLISEAWSSLTPPGAICKHRSPVRSFVLVHKLKSQIPVESEPWVFALWLLVTEKRLVQNVAKTHRI